jgi:hypothetical protein
MTYGRSRLLLGIGGVGTWVVLASVALATGLPERMVQLTQGRLGADTLALIVLAIVVVLIQAPFDLFGGYILPRRHGRSSERFAGYARRWLRGIAAYQTTVLLIGLLVLLASRGGGVPGMVLGGIATSVLLLVVRTPFASLIGGMQRPEPDEALGYDAMVMASPDIGFTGGVEGVLRARRQIIPRKWAESLSTEMLSLSIRRRREAVASGLWLRGRIASVAFIWAGLVIAGSQIHGLVGTSGGVLQFAAVLTLWSFFGLLVLPTVSRRASMVIDKRLADQGVETIDLSKLASTLDSMQDDEPSRPKWIERIFHPIPNVTARTRESTSLRFAAWDVARTSAYLGVCGLSPLGRAVHCNSGRPSLWVYLPLD